MNKNVSLNKNLLVIISIVLLYLVLRVYLASISSYGFYHGWNEAHYSNIAKNYFTHSLLYQLSLIGSPAFNSLPPLYSYAVYASFKIFGISDISARLISIFSEIIAVLSVYLLARELYNKKTAVLSSLIFLFIPWNVLWFGRVQTDPLMTALMTASIALYVYAYSNNKSMLPFGICFGLAVFTKQPALVILPIIVIWSYLVGVKKQLLIKGVMFAIIGLVPLFMWLSYYLFVGDLNFLSHIAYGELANRTVPFADFMKVTVLTAIGISPLILFFAFYELIKSKNKKNILYIWLVLYSIFVIIRTPPSHEYYSLPLTPVFTILAAEGMIKFSNTVVVRKYIPSKAFLVILILVTSSSIPVTYALLSYSGDMGYTCTEDVGNYLNKYMDSHPDETFLIVAPGRYVPQIVWYTNLTAVGYSDRQVYGISNDLSSVSIKDLANITDETDAISVFLVVDDRQGFMNIIEEYYEKVYETEYITRIPNIANVYTGEDAENKYFKQDLTVFKLH